MDWPGLLARVRRFRGLEVVQLTRSEARVRDQKHQDVEGGGETRPGKADKTKTGIIEKGWPTAIPGTSVVPPPDHARNCDGLLEIPCPGCGHWVKVELSELGNQVVEINNALEAIQVKLFHLGLAVERIDDGVWFDHPQGGQ